MQEEEEKERCEEQAGERAGVLGEDAGRQGGRRCRDGGLHWFGRGGDFWAGGWCSRLCAAAGGGGISPDREEKSLPCLVGGWCTGTKLMGLLTGSMHRRSFGEFGISPLRAAAEIKRPFFFSFILWAQNIEENVYFSCIK